MRMSRVITPKEICIGENRKHRARSESQETMCAEKGFQQCCGDVEESAWSFRETLGCLGEDRR